MTGGGKREEGVNGEGSDAGRRGSAEGGLRRWEDRAQARVLMREEMRANEGWKRAGKRSSGEVKGGVIRRERSANECWRRVPEGRKRETYLVAREPHFVM